MILKIRIIGCFALAAFSLFGCGRLLPIPDGPGARITEIPARSELLGTWQLTDASVAELKREGFKGEISERNHTISLLSEGRCEVHAYDSYTADSSTPKYISTTGTWTINLERRVVTYVVLSIHWGDQGSGTNSGVFDMRLAKDQGRFVFWSFMTDPDERIYYEFAKVSNKKE